MLFINFHVRGKHLYGPLVVQTKLNLHKHKWTPYLGNETIMGCLGHTLTLKQKKKGSVGLFFFRFCTPSIRASSLDQTSLIISNKIILKSDSHYILYFKNVKYFNHFCGSHWSAEDEHNTRTDTRAQLDDRT